MHRNVFPKNFISFLFAIACSFPDIHVCNTEEWAGTSKSCTNRSFAHSDGYPGWAPNPQSVLLEKTVGAYERLFGTEPKVRAIHAGLECGLFLEKYPELEMVSFGPTLRGVHSPDERLEIATVPKFWDLLLEVLKTV